jgi:plasmid maintenance system antidote protein VapI
MGKKRDIGSRLAAQTGLRLPEDLRLMVIEAADNNGRSRNTEMVIRLRESFDAARQGMTPIDIQTDLHEMKREMQTMRRELARITELLAAKK